MRVSVSRSSLKSQVERVTVLRFQAVNFRKQEERKTKSEMGDRG